MQLHYYWVKVAHTHDRFATQAGSTSAKREMMNCLTDGTTQFLLVLKQKQRCERATILLPVEWYNLLIAVSAHFGCFIILLIIALCLANYGLPKKTHQNPPTVNHGLNHIFSTDPSMTIIRQPAGNS